MKDGAESRGAETARRVREAALTLFARHGYAAVSMREIAAEVGVGAAAIYNHFATKQDLLVELMTDHLTELLADWDGQPEAAADTPPAEALEAFTRFHIRFHRRRTDEVFVAYMELRSLEQPNFHAIDRLRAAYEKRLEDILRRGHEQGVFDAPSPQVCATAVVAMLTGVTSWYRHGGRTIPAEIEDLHVCMVARAVRPE